MQELASVVRADQMDKLETIHFRNLVFTNNCKLASESGLIISDVANKKCVMEQIVERSDLVASDSSRLELLSITARLDSGERLAIFSDQLCQNYELNSFAFPRKLNDLQVEKMSVDEFCQKWISNQNLTNVGSRLRSE